VAGVARPESVSIAHAGVVVDAIAISIRGAARRRLCLFPTARALDQAHGLYL